MQTQKIIVNGILLKNNEVLIAKRPISKKIAPGKYHLPGGHVEFGEETVDSLVREFKEEFGINVNVGDIFRSFSYVIDDAHTVGMSFILSSGDDLSSIDFDKEDTEEIRWVNINDFGDFFNHEDYDYITLKLFFDKLQINGTKI